jgi:methylthioribose-1-phosphate isomerase
MVRGRNIETGQMSIVRITPEGVGSGKERWQGVYNPSFDVTPAELISEYRSDRADSGCVVTEKGVAERKEGEKHINVESVC